MEDTLMRIEVTKEEFSSLYRDGYKTVMGKDRLPTRLDFRTGSNSIHFKDIKLLELARIAVDIHNQDDVIFENIECKSPLFPTGLNY